VAQLRASIVVPTRGRPAQLRSCLETLAAQEPAGIFEIVVVDDGSPDPAAIEAATVSIPTATVVRLGGRGPAAARNAGVAAARAPIVCFTDDDCEPSPSWARALVQAARGCGVAAGRTLPPPGAGAAVVASQSIVEHLQLSSLERGGRLGFAPACNLAARREALALLPFDESYPGAAAEDRDWCERAAGAGLAPIYVPGAIVVHRQAPGARSFIGRQYRYGRGAARFRRGGADRRLAPPSFYADLVRRGFDGGPSVGALVLSGLAATAAGVAAERLDGRARPRFGGRGGRP
jgi:glycosyltransferase involved in cell wall biosynthesis